MISAQRYCFFLILCILPEIWCKCAITLQDADKCGVKFMFFGNREAVIPHNENQMDLHCGEARGGVSCLREYSVNCLTGFSQQLFGMILTNAGLHMDRRCNDSKNRQEFIEHAKCLTSKEKKERLDVCSDRHLAMMEKIKALSNDDRIPASCCSFHQFFDCIVKTSKEICGDGTSQYWDDIIDEIADESVAFACAEFDTLDNCDKLMSPNVWQPLKDIINIEDHAVLASKHIFNSTIVSLLEIIEKYQM